MQPHVQKANAAATTTMTPAPVYAMNAGKDVGQPNPRTTSSTASASAPPDATTPTAVPMLRAGRSIVKP